jgi:hypothetical protein
LKNEAAATFVADAGYEKAVFWMSRQQDMLSALQKGVPGSSGTINLPNGDCNYQIELFTFVGARPVYRIISHGHSGMSNTTVEVLVLQAMSGWDMGMCRVPLGSATTSGVYFADGEIVAMPLHINNLGDSPDRRDIYISGSPQFLRPVAVSESRYDISGSDKYASGIGLFAGGIYFDQPDSRVTDEASLATKVDRFRNSTKAQFRFKPVDNTPLGSVDNPHPAVQLEFFVEGGIGKVRITDNCTVRGFQQAMDDRTWDFRIVPGSGGKQYQRHDIYAYHFISENALTNGERFTRPIDQTYVTQSVGAVQSEPGGQIFVDGNVIIGGDQTLHNGDQVVKGKITVAATGNIWIADSVVVDGPHDANGMPSQNNPNVLGLVAQGVIRIVDPGMSGYNAGGRDNYPGPALVFQTDVTQPIWAVQSESVGQKFWLHAKTEHRGQNTENRAQKTEHRIQKNLTSDFYINPSVPRLVLARHTYGGLAQRVRRAVDPGMFDYDAGGRNNYIGPPIDEQIKYVGWRGARRQREEQEELEEELEDLLEDMEDLREDMEEAEAEGDEEKIEELLEKMEKLQEEIEALQKQLGQNTQQVEGFEYVPIGRRDAGGGSETYDRHLPVSMVIEAAITVGGGGWGAENVERNTYGGRKEAPGSGNQNNLIIRGTVTEAVRGVVELIGTDGYLKRYYLDERLFEGILPGDIWLQSKYIPAPAGWRDY